MQNSTTRKVNGCAAAARAVAEIEADLRTFEAEERRRLGLEEDRQHWRDSDAIPFTEIAVVVDIKHQRDFRNLSS